MLLALARPQWGFAWEEAKQQGLDIIVAMDTSRSMLAQDVPPTAWRRPSWPAIDLMRLAKTDRLGLVAFAGTGLFASAPHTGRTAFQQAVDAVSVGIIPQGGTALSAAIRTALAAFEKGNDNHKVLVLFTDGEDHDADAETLAAAKEAAQAGMRIFTIGVGTPEGELLRVADEQGNTAFVKDDDGNVVKSHLNQTLLQQIATEADGFYLPLQGANPMETLYARGLAPLPKTEEATRLTRVYRERYHWPLGFAVLCLVIEVLLPESPRSRRTDAAAAAAAAQAAAADGRCSCFCSWRRSAHGFALQRLSRLSSRRLSAVPSTNTTGSPSKKPTITACITTPAPPPTRPKNWTARWKAIQRRPQFRRTSSPTRKRSNTPITTWATPSTTWANRCPTRTKKNNAGSRPSTSYIRALRLNTNDLDAKNNLAYVKKKLEELKQQQQQQQKQRPKPGSKGPGPERPAAATKPGQK